MSVHLDVGEETLCAEVGRSLSKECVARRSVDEVSVGNGAGSSSSSFCSLYSRNQGSAYETEIGGQVKVQLRLRRAQ